MLAAAVIAVLLITESNSANNDAGDRWIGNLVRSEETVSVEDEEEQEARRNYGRRPSFAQTPAPSSPQLNCSVLHIVSVRKSPAPIYQPTEFLTGGLLLFLRSVFLR